MKFSVIDLDNLRSDPNTSIDLCQIACEEYFEGLFWCISKFHNVLL